MPNPYYKGGNIQPSPFPLKKGKRKKPRKKYKRGSERKQGTWTTFAKDKLKLLDSLD